MSEVTIFSTFFDALRIPVLKGDVATTHLMVSMGKRCKEKLPPVPLAYLSSLILENRDVDCEKKTYLLQTLAPLMNLFDPKVWFSAPNISLEDGFYRFSGYPVAKSCSLVLQNIVKTAEEAKLAVRIAGVCNHRVTTKPVEDVFAKGKADVCVAFMDTFLKYHAKECYAQETARTMRNAVSVLDKSLLKDFDEMCKKHNFVLQMSREERAQEILRRYQEELKQLAGEAGAEAPQKKAKK